MSRRDWHIPEPRSRAERLLIALLAAQLVPVAVVFPYYAFARQDLWGLRAFAAALAALGVAALAGAWRRAPWALWAVVVLAASKLVVDFFGYALARERTSSIDAFNPGVAVGMGIDVLLLLGAIALNAALLAIAFRRAGSMGPRVTRGQRAFFACVLALAAWVAVRGLLFPGHLSRTIPFEVPPLHSRFLGAMYLSGAAFMGLSIRARAWSEVRIVVPMVAVWTGMLGLVSLRFLDAFDWRRAPTWTWFVAYSAFPIVAAWIAWRQRGETSTGARSTSGPDAEPQPASSPETPSTPPATLRAFLIGLGALLTLLAAALLVAPEAMAARWPWTIGVQLAQVYSAPFLSFGLGGLMAARARSMGELRIPLAATLVFTAAVLAASLLHRGLFAPDAPATWLWFGGFGLAAAVLARYVLARS